MVVLTDRQIQLFEILQTRQRVSTEEIKSQFGISSATAFRDIRALVLAGVAVKVSHGIKLAAPEELPLQGRQCFSCGRPLQERTLFILQMEDGNQRSACCCHCGLAAFEQGGVKGALAADFISGQMVDARQAAYVLGSRVSLCCEPSILCFANKDEARRFQKGFGGSLENMSSAIEKIKSQGRNPTVTVGKS